MNLLETKIQFNLIRNILTKNITTPYIGWLGHNNLGDEILFEAHLKLFKQLNLVHFQQSKFLEKYEMLSKKPLYNLGILGGGTLINQPGVLDQVKYLINKKVNMFCFGTGVIDLDFLQSTAFNYEDNRYDWVESLSKFIFVGVRGPYSKKLLDDVGFKNSVIIGDTALSLANNEYNVKPSKKIVGINFGINKVQPSWGNSNKYRDEIVILINKLIEKDYKVHLLPIFKEDIKSNLELLNLINNKNCTLHVGYSNLKEYRNVLNQCDVFMGQKLHSTIIACMDRIPSIMIEYNPKCKDFMKSINMDEYMLKTSDFSAEKAYKLLNLLYTQKLQVVHKLNKKIMYFKRIQNNYASKILSNLYL